MAKFIRIKVGSNADWTYDFNLESIESVDLTGHRVYTVGSKVPYIVQDKQSWEKIMGYIEQNR